MRGSRQTSELLSTTVDGRVDSGSEDGPIRCDICGRHVRSSKGMLNHLRQDANCREKRSNADSPAGHPIILEHPGGSTNHLVITLPDSPPPPAMSTTNAQEMSMAPNNPAPLEDHHSTKLKEVHQGLLESLMPNDAPLNAGDVTLHQGADSLNHTDPWWPDVQDSFAGSGDPATSQESIMAQLMAVPRAPSSLFQQQVPFTNDVTGLICASPWSVSWAQQSYVSMGFEAPLVREPMLPMAPMAPPTDQTFPPTLEPFSPIPHAQGSEVHGESSSNGADLDVGNQPSFNVPVPSGDTALYFLRTPLYDFNCDPFSIAGSFMPPPYASPPCNISQPFSPGATLSLVEDASDGAGDAVPMNPSTVASMNPLNLPPGQLPLPGGPELGSAPAIHVPEYSAETAAAAMLQRSRVPKPNAPAIMLLIQENTCPTCKKDKPHPGERDMKSHIRTELPYRTTEGQVILLRGRHPKLPLAFTIDGQGYKNGIFWCPFCIHRVQVVCGGHPNDSHDSTCPTCRSFMATGIAHLGSHLTRLQDPRLYVPGHHDTCPGAERGCNCIPHYWRV
ncbi:unnamed protein product [Clonostachys solani]|uniref:Uncharacterized protein n=1 Tax=Clonostachys solani TaxID=160281 RepID=A0A9N9YZL7_9HYPO|nr:unnamed protein product [Clonostachys solani]